MSMLFTSVPTKTLAQTITASSTKLIVNNINGWDGNALTSSDFGTRLFAVLRNSDNTLLEIKELDPSTTANGATTGFDILAGGLKFTGDLSTEVSANKLTWVKNQTFVELGTNAPQLLNHMVQVIGAQTIAGVKTFSSLPATTAGDAVADNDLVRKAQLDAAALGQIGTDKVIVAGNAGETIADGELVYFDTVTNNEWMKCDASTAASVNNVLLGIAQGAGTDGGAISGGVLLYGVDDAQTGMTGGDVMYASDTAGDIASSAGSVEVVVGIAKSETELYFNPRFAQQLTEDQKDALVGSSGTPSSSNPFLTQDDTSSTPVADKVVRYNSNANLAVYDFEPVSGENLTSGDPVYLNQEDSKLYISHGFKEESSNSWTHPTTLTSYQISKLDDTQSLILWNTGSSLYVRAITTATGATVDDGTVTTSFDETSNDNEKLPSATVVRLSDTTFVVFYAYTSNSDLYFRTGTLSGSTITMDTETQYTGSPNYCFGLSAVPGASDGEVALGYFDGAVNPGSSGTWNMVLSYLTVSTDSVTVDDTVSYSQASGSYNATPRWGHVAFTNGVAYGLYSCTTSGGVESIKYNWIRPSDSSSDSAIATLNLENPAGAGDGADYANVVPYFVGHSGKGYFGYTTAISGTVVKTVLEIDQIGCKNFYQMTKVLDTADTTVAALPMFGNEMGVVVQGFSQSPSAQNYSTIYIQRGNIYNFYDASYLGTTSAPNVRAFFSNARDEIVISRSGSYIKVLKMPTLFDGFSRETVTAPSTTTIEDKYLTTTGLTANAPYYLKDEYTTAGDTDFVGVIPIGQALSATIMHVK